LANVDDGVADEICIYIYIEIRKKNEQSKKEFANVQDGVSDGRF